jgi:hypothetical protein
MAGPVGPTQVGAEIINILRAKGVRQATPQAVEQVLRERPDLALLVPAAGVLGAKVERDRGSGGAVIRPMNGEG